MSAHSDSLKSEKNLLDGQTYANKDDADDLYVKVKGTSEDSVLMMDSTETSDNATANGKLDVENQNKEPKRTRVGKVKQEVEVAAEKTRSCCTNYWSDVCSLDHLKQRLPIINWLPKYKPSTFKCDLIAGLTVGLTVIPQGMAYADLAGLDLQYGLYSAFMGCFLYVLLGTSKDITLGPTAIMSILVAEYSYDRWGHPSPEAEHSTNATLAILLTFLCGAIQLLMTIFRLGFLVRYISHPVIAGFTSAASIVISMTQLKKIFGIKTPRGFFQTIYYLFRNIATTKIWDFVLGVSSMIILFLLKYAKNRWSTVEPSDSTCKKVFKTILWIVGTGRNAVIVVLAALIAFGITDIEKPVKDRPLTLTQNITGGVPPFALPKFSYQVPGTNQTVPFGELVSALGSALVVIPLMGFLESIAIAKAFGRKNNYKVDPSQELFAIGVGNFLSSFVSSYPITGSFGRSAVNAQSNVMTPMGGIFTGAVVLLSLQFLASAFQYIPEAALGAVIIMAVINLFDWQGMRHVWHVNKLDVLPLIVTFFLCFWDIAYGIMAGIGVSILILLANHSRPKAKREKMKNSESVVIIKIKRGLDFPGAEYIEDKFQEQSEAEEVTDVIVDCSNLTTLDYSGAEAILHGANSFQKQKIQLRLCCLTKGQTGMLERMELKKSGCKFYATVEDAKQDLSLLSDERIKE